MAIGLNHETEIARPNQDSITAVGSVYGSARSATPSGYLLCDGSLISRTTYSRLFNVISTIYGNGDGSTTFALPDLRGAVPRGVGTSNGYSQNVTITLGSKQDDTVQSHTHQHLITGAGAPITYNNPPTTATLVDLTWASTQSNSGRSETETRMKNLGMNFFIKF
jgi:microcystin-dependent protein